MFALRCSRPVARAASLCFAPRTLPLVVRAYSTEAPSYEHILVSTPKPGVGLSMFLTIPHRTPELARWIDYHIMQADSP
jgi:hypothetical protein